MISKTVGGFCVAAGFAFRQCLSLKILERIAHIRPASYKVLLFGEITVMRKFAIATFFLISCLPARATMGTARLFGIGQYSCATWLSDENHENQGVVWIWGFWSGANARNGANHDTGKSTDGPGIAALVKKECQEYPTELLATITSEVYDDLSNHGR